MNGAVSKVNKKFISQLTRAKRTPSTAATVPDSHVLTLNLLKTTIVAPHSNASK